MPLLLMYRKTKLFSKSKLMTLCVNIQQKSKLKAAAAAAADITAAVAHTAAADITAAEVIIDNNFKGVLL